MTKASPFEPTDLNNDPLIEAAKDKWHPRIVLPKASRWWEEEWQEIEDQIPPRATKGVWSLCIKAFIAKIEDQSYERGKRDPLETIDMLRYQSKSIELYKAVLRKKIEKLKNPEITRPGYLDYPESKGTIDTMGQYLYNQALQDVLELLK